MDVRPAPVFWQWRRAARRFDLPGHDPEHEVAQRVCRETGIVTPDVDLVGWTIETLSPLLVLLDDPHEAEQQRAAAARAAVPRRWQDTVALACLMGRVAPDEPVDAQDLAALARRIVADQAYRITREFVAGISTPLDTSNRR